MSTSAIAGSKPTLCEPTMDFVRPEEMPRPSDVALSCLSLKGSIFSEKELEDSSKIYEAVMQRPLLPEKEGKDTNRRSQKEISAILSDHLLVKRERNSQVSWTVAARWDLEDIWWKFKRNAERRKKYGIGYTMHEPAAFLSASLLSAVVDESLQLTRWTTGSLELANRPGIYRWIRDALENVHQPEQF